MTPHPFFSIIMASYNRANLLERALNSLCHQTETDFEVILIDDGSTDDTRNHIRQYQSRLNLTYIKQENQGFIAAKNNGIVLAKGKYISFLDSDDAYKPTHLSSRKKLIDAQPEVDLWHGGAKIIGSEYVPDEANPYQQIHLSQCAISGTFFIKRIEMLRLNGFKGTPLNTDADFMKRAINAGLKIEKTDLETYVYHREAEDSITKKLSK